MSAATPGQALHDSLRESAVIEFDLDIESFESWDHIRPSQRNRMEAAAQAVLKIGVCPHGDLAAETRELRERLDAIRKLCEARIRVVGMVDGKGVARKVIAIIDKPAEP